MEYDHERIDGEVLRMDEQGSCQVSCLPGYHQDMKGSGIHFHEIDSPLFRRLQGDFPQSYLEEFFQFLPAEARQVIRKQCLHSWRD